MTLYLLGGGLHSTEHIFFFHFVKLDSHRIVNKNWILDVLIIKTENISSSSSLTFLGALGLVMFQNRHWNISIGKAQTDEETISTTV